MNKILVSGLAIGNEDELDTCQACNYDLDWLFMNPSTLLWADKIILTPKIINHIKKSLYPGKSVDFGRAVNTIFEHLDKNNLIEIRKPSEIIDDNLKDAIYRQIEKDKYNLCINYPENVTAEKTSSEEQSGHINILGMEYCTPSLWTSYASLVLAKQWKANLFLPNYSRVYFEHIFLQQSRKVISNEKMTAFDDIFTSKLPEFELLPFILLDKNSCNTCKSLNLCESDVFRKLEYNLSRAMEWRSYDEVQQLKIVLAKITKDIDTTNIDSKEIIDKYKGEELRIQKRLRSIFPKVERWSNMVTVLSAFVAIGGLTTGCPPLTIAGAVTAGISTITNKSMDILKSKYRWVAHKII